MAGPRPTAPAVIEQHGNARKMRRRCVLRVAGTTMLIMKRRAFTILSGLSFLLCVGTTALSPTSFRENSLDVGKRVAAHLRHPLMAVGDRIETPAVNGLSNCHHPHKRSSRAHQTNKSAAGQIMVPPAEPVAQKQAVRGRASLTASEGRVSRDEPLSFGSIHVGSSEQQWRNRPGSASGDPNPASRRG